MRRFLIHSMALTLTSVLTVLLALVGCDTFESDCGDGVDNDVDGWLDCYDTDCGGSGLCDGDADDDPADDDDDDDDGWPSDDDDDDGAPSCDILDCDVEGFAYSCATSSYTVNYSYGGSGPNGLSSYTVDFTNGHWVRCSFYSSYSGSCKDDTGSSCSF